jgi:hypothetical protein
VSRVAQPLGSVVGDGVHALVHLLRCLAREFRGGLLSLPDFLSNLEREEKKKQSSAYDNSQKPEDKKYMPSTRCRG